MRLIYFLGVLFLISSCSLNPIEEEDSIQNLYTNKKITNNKSQTFYQDLEYGTHDQQKFDLYKPLNNQINASKVIITLHGGGWIQGDKSSMTDFIATIQGLNPNHTIVNMNYRLASPNQYAFPDQFLDIDNLINYLSTNKKIFNIIPEFALIGKSAGGHLALQYASVYDTTDNVKFVCSLAGPTNFLTPFYMDNPDFSYLFELLIDQDHYQNNHKVLKLISPVYQSSYSNSPTLLFHGINDEVVPFENFLELKNTLKNLEVPVTYVKLDEGHAGWSQENMEIVHAAIEKFINQYL